MAAYVKPFFGAMRRALEPWYTWGLTDIFRINVVERDFSDESAGRAFRAELQWLGIHFGIVIGRTPPAISAAERSAYKARLAAKAVR